MVDRIDYDLHRARATRLRAQAMAAAWQQLAALLFARKPDLASVRPIADGGARRDALQPAG